MTASRPLDPEFWRDRPVFVTGATGLQGSWLVKALLARGADVAILMRDWVPQAELCRAGLLETVRVVRGDVRDQELIERALAEYEIKTVFHLAAQAIVPIANRSPLSTFDTNIKGTWTVLEACRRTPGIEQVVLASSDKAYGPAPTLPYDEAMPLRGTFPYDVSKSCADLLASTYAGTYNLPVIIPRCANFYGGGDLNFNRLIPGTIRSILRNQRPVLRSDGRFIRDYLYVEDAAEAFCLLVQRLAERPELRGEAFNISYDLRLTALEVVERILKLMDRQDLRPVILGEASREIREQALNPGKIKRVLGWKPRYTFEDGLQRTIQWYRAFFEQPAAASGEASARRAGAQPRKVVARRAK